jgi:hypothetical protein
MSPALRNLFVAEPAAAVQGLGAVREGGPVQARLAPTADVLRETLIDPDAAMLWDAVVFVPGGPVEEVEVAVFARDGVPMFVVGDEVRLLLAETAAEAITMDAFGGLYARVAPPEPTVAEVADSARGAETPAPAFEPAASEPAPTSPMQSPLPSLYRPGTW